MARIKKKAEFIEATETLVGEPMDIQALVFGKTQKQRGREFVYHTSLKEGKTARFTSFSESAEVVEKDGFAEIKVKPFDISRKVTFTALDMEAQKFGETEFQGSGYVSDPRVVGEQCHLGALKRRKLMIGSVLAYHNLTLKRDGLDAEFNVPTSNREVLTAGLWNTGQASPIADMRRAVATMNKKPTMAIMNPNTYLNMIKNGDLVSEANTNNVPKNYQVNEAMDNNKSVYKTGRVLDPLINLDIYVWSETPDGTDYYLPDGYVAYTRKDAGLTGFSGIPSRKTPNSPVQYIAAEFDVSEAQVSDPIEDVILYKSSPIYILKENQGFYSQKVY